MTDERWGDTIDNIEESFGIEERHKEEDNLEDDVGVVIKGEKEIVIFKNPLGRVKLERTVRPLIEDKKMHYHKGTGGTARVEFVVSKTEFTRTLKAYLEDKDTGEWDEIDTSGGTFKF